MAKQAHTTKVAEIEGGTYSEDETVARREAALKRMLSMPQTPNKPAPARPGERP